MKNLMKNVMKNLVRNNKPMYRHLISWMLSGLLLLPGIAAAGQTLENFAGKPQTIGDYAQKGKWLVVMIWASDCPVCNSEVHNYVDFYKAHKDKDATVLGISMDGEERKLDAEDFLDRHKVTFPSLIGEPQVVARVFQDITNDNFRGTPTFLVYGPDGTIRGQQAGAVPTDVIESFIAREAKADTQQSGK
jgi:peroxiredoxin